MQHHRAIGSSVDSLLQVLFEDDEYQQIRESAQRERVTIAEWVRQAIRKAQVNRADTVDARLKAVATASRHQFPTGDIDEMLADIERGRGIH